MKRSDKKSAKLSDVDTKRIKALRKSGKTYAAIAKQYKVWPGTIRMVCDKTARMYNHMLATDNIAKRIKYEKGFRKKLFTSQNKSNIKRIHASPKLQEFYRKKTLEIYYANKEKLND